MMETNKLVEMAGCDGGRQKEGSRLSMIGFECTPIRNQERCISVAVES